MAKLLQPARHLDLEGAYNVRELGGYRTSSGRTTRWKTFLRADSPHRLTGESQSALLDYGVRTVIDLRRDVELEERPNVFAGSPGVAYHQQDIAGEKPMWELAGDPAPEDRTDRRAWGYAMTLDHRRTPIRETLATLSEPGARPALFHCAGGTDRTGIIAALVLGIAGVPSETIVEDYTLSARYLTEMYFAEWESPEEGFTWETYQARYCPPEVMQKTLQHLDEKYGGTEGYMRAIGLTTGQIDSLRNALVG